MPASLSNASITTIHSSQNLNVQLTSTTDLQSITQNNTALLSPAQHQPVKAKGSAEFIQTSQRISAAQQVKIHYLIDQVRKNNVPSLPNGATKEERNAWINFRKIIYKILTDIPHYKFSEAEKIVFAHAFINVLKENEEGSFKLNDLHNSRIHLFKLLAIQNEQERIKLAYRCLEIAPDMVCWEADTFDISKLTLRTAHKNLLFSRHEKRRP